MQVQDAFASRGASAGGATHVCTAHWGLEKVLKPQRLPQAAALRARGRRAITAEGAGGRSRALAGLGKGADGRLM